VIGMLIIVFVLVETTTCCTVYPWELPWDQWEPSLQSSVIFLTIDWVSITGIILGNILFLLIRSFCRHKADLEQVVESKQIPSAESVIAMKTVMEQFSTHFVCFFICVYKSTPESQQFEETVILYFMIISFALITALLFVPWNKGPQWWVQMGPKLRVGCIYANYIFMPAGLSVYFVIQFVRNEIADSSVNPYATFYIFFMSICLGRFIEFLVLIKPKLAERQNERNLGELSNELVSEREERLPYTEQPRKYGMGDCRIGQPLELESGIYELAYISWVRSDRMDRFFDIITSKHKEEQAVNYSINVRRFSDVVDKSESDLLADENTNLDQ
jgi:hypothetical protein